MLQLTPGVGGVQRDLTAWVMGRSMAVLHVRRTLQTKAVLQMAPTSPMVAMIAASPVLMDG